MDFGLQYFSTNVDHYDICIIFARVIPAQNAQDKSVKYALIIYAFLLNLLKLPFQDKPNLVFLPKTTETAKYKLITTAATT